MKKLLWFGIPLMVLAAGVSARAQNPPPQQSITLYAPKQPGDLGRVSVDLQRAVYAPRLNFGDLGYGLGRIGKEWDWLQVSNVGDRRTVIRDIGQHAWTDNFTVPWLEPLAPLKPGEGRRFFVTAKGKDGAGSAGGYDGLSAYPSDGPDRTYVENPRPRPAKGDGETQTSPDTLKAVLDHIYVIHVVDDQRDFYALVRIDALQTGDNCTISWKMIPPPPQPPAKKKKK